MAATDEPTPGELMRAFERVERNQAANARETQEALRDLGSKIEKDYLRADVYSRDAQNRGERIGALERENAAIRTDFNEYKSSVADKEKTREARTSADRRLIYTSLVAPMILFLAFKLLGS